MGARPADRAPVADLWVADPAGRVDQERVAGADGRVLEDLAVGGSSADLEGIVGLDDLVDAIDVPDVDEQARLGQAQLDQRQQAVAARQDLRLAFPLGQDPERVMESGRPDVVELTRDHPSSFASLVGRRKAGSPKRRARSLVRLEAGLGSDRHERPRDPGRREGSCERG